MHLGALPRCLCLSCRSVPLPGGPAPLTAARGPPKPARLLLSIPFLDLRQLSFVPRVKSELRDPAQLAVRDLKPPVCRLTWGRSGSVRDAATLASAYRPCSVPAVTQRPCACLCKCSSSLAPSSGAMVPGSEGSGRLLQRSPCLSQPQARHVPTTKGDNGWRRQQTSGPVMLGLCPSRCPT